MSRDRIDALADELFAAAREERPDRDLVDRVERALGSPDAPPQAAELARSRAPAASERGAPRQRPGIEHGRRSFWAPLLLAALVAGGVASLWLGPPARDGVIISAEHAPGGSVSSPPESAPDPLAQADEAAIGVGNAASRSPLAGSSDDPRSAVEVRPPATGSRAKPARARSAALPSRGQNMTPSGVDTSAHEAEGAPNAALKPGLARELDALKQIRQALRQHDGSAALALLDRYDTGQYGASLALEARMLRIEALESVGRRAEAEAIARRFVRDNPDSPLAERAQRFIDRIDPARPDAAASPR